MSLNMLSMMYEPKRRVSLFLRSGLGLQDSRSYEQDFLEDTKKTCENPKDYQNRQYRVCG